MSEAIETAKMHIQNAETWAYRDEYDRASAAALTGIGFALIGIGEALEPTEPMLLEVAEKKLPLAVLAYVENEYNRLQPFVGRGVQLTADDPRYDGPLVQGYLTHIERLDTYVLCTVALERADDHVQCVSARVRPVVASNTAHRTSALDMRDSATQRALDEELGGL